MEITKLKDFPGYGVTEDGSVWSYKRGIFLHPGTNGSGYLYVSLRIDGKTKNMLVHRLVALTFLSNPEGKAQVNHIDGDKTNNSLANLEWNTSSENTRHAFATGLASVKYKRKPIRCVETGQIFESVSEAARVLGIHQSNISHVLKGLRKQTGGYTFNYMEEN